MESKNLIFLFRIFVTEIQKYNLPSPHPEFFMVRMMGHTSVCTHVCGRYFILAINPAHTSLCAHHTSPYYSYYKQVMLALAPLLVSLLVSLVSTKLVDLAIYTKEQLVPYVD